MGAKPGAYYSQATRAIDHGKLLEILQESLGGMLSPEELEEAADRIQVQLRERVMEKFQTGYP